MVQQSSAFSGSNGRWYSLKIILTQTSQSIENNTSTVRAEVHYISKASTASVVWYGSDRTLTLDICGVRESVTVNPNLSGGQDKLLFSKNYTVSHHSDGTKSVSGYAHFDGESISFLGNSSVTVYLSLSTIPRASTVGNITATLGNAVTININKLAGGFIHKIRYSFGSSSGDIANRVDTSTSWTPPLSLANQIRNSDVGTGLIYVDTFKSGTLIGSKSALLTLRVPTSVAPVLQNMTVTERNNDVSRLLGNGRFLQHLSNLRLTISGATGAYGSTIVKQTVRIGNITKDGAQVDIDNVQQSGQVTITGTVTDSRGRSASKTITVTIMPYHLPKITAFLPARTGNGTNTAMQASLIVNVKAVTISNVNKNTYKIVIHRSERNKMMWDKVYESDAIVEQFNRTISLGTGYLSEKSYDIRLTVTDKFNQQQSALVTVGTVKVVMALGRHNVGVGKVPDDTYGFDVDGKIQSSMGFFVDGKSVQNYQLTQDNGRTLQIAGKDLNTITKTGYYSINQAVNAPIGADVDNKGCYLFVIQESDNFLMQQYIEKLSANIWYRFFEKTTKWSAWNRLARHDHKNLVNTGWIPLHQSGVFYKKVGDIVCLRLNFISKNTGTTLLGILPKSIFPYERMMLHVSAWSVDIQEDKHIQINENGMVHILNDSYDTKYYTQVSFCI